MIIIMSRKSTKDDLKAVVEKIENAGLSVHLSEGSERTIVGAIGEERLLDKESLLASSGVERVVPILAPYKLASREFKPEDTVIEVGPAKYGSKRIEVIAGPCTVESREQIIESAHKVKEAGASALRGGAFKPRTNPYSFQGLMEEGLQYLAEAREQTGLPIVTEVMDTEDVKLVEKYADVLQIGTRNMQNFLLLKAVGNSTKPVLLKRGMSSSLEEFLLAAEYILSQGNSQVMLCERGIRTFETFTRNTLSLNIVPMLKEFSHLPVIVDPSHGTGVARLVSPMSKASVAAGADGLIIEVHPDPKKALTDGAQSLNPDQLKQMMKELKPVAEAVGRKL